MLKSKSLLSVGIQQTKSRKHYYDENDNEWCVLRQAELNTNFRKILNVGSSVLKIFIQINKPRFPFSL